MGRIFKCQNASCSNRFNDAVAAYKAIIESGVCPECGAKLIPEEIDSIQWYREAFDDFPCVIACKYRDLYDLHLANDIYGQFIGIKDSIETTIKFCVLAVCAWGESKNLPDRRKYYEKHLSQQLSLGDWYDILVLIEKYYSERDKKAERPIPKTLSKLVEKIKRWTKCNRNGENVDLTKWRNDYYGHGAMHAKDDQAFIRDLNDKLVYISEFYRTNAELFQSIELRINGQSYMGSEMARSLTFTGQDCFLYVDENEIPLTPYILNTQYGVYFYDSLVRSLHSKMLSYISGDSDLRIEPHFLELLSVLKSGGDVRKRDYNATVFSRKEYDFIARLSINEEYIPPHKLVDWLETSIRENSKGLFLLQMKRGCGKTYFTEKLNTRFKSPQILLEGTIDVRTIHLVKTQTGGVDRFLKDLKHEWELACFENDQLFDTEGMPAPDDDPVNNAIALARFLNYWRGMTEERRSTEKIMLVLDGLDEITEENDLLWSYIPTAEMLDEGVYILLTSRVPGEDNLPLHFAERVEALDVCSRASDEMVAQANTDLLYGFFKTKKIKDEELIQSMIGMADHRIIGLPMLYRILQNNDSGSINPANFSEIVKAYIKMLEGFYGENRSMQMRQLLIVLLTVGKYELLSLREMADLLMMDAIRLDLLDMLSDLSPLLLIERGYITDEGTVQDVNRYRFLEDVFSAVEDYLPKEEIETVLMDIVSIIRVEINSAEQSPEYSDGVFAFLAHEYQLLKKNELSVAWTAKDVNGIVRYAEGYDIVKEAEKDLVDRRRIGIYRSSFEISNAMSEVELKALGERYRWIYEKLSGMLLAEHRYEAAVRILNTALRVNEKLNGSRQLPNRLFLLTELASCYHETRDPKRQEIFIQLLELITKNTFTGADLIIAAKARIVIFEEAFSHTTLQLLTDSIEILSHFPDDVEALKLEARARYDWALEERDAEHKDDVTRFLENISICKKYEARFPGCFIDWMAFNLNSAGGYYKNLGDHTGSMDALEKACSYRLEADAYLEALFRERGMKIAPDYAMNCNGLGNAYRALGRPAEGKKYLKEAVRLRELLYQRDRRAVLVDLAHTYSNYGHLLVDLGDYDEAVSIVKKAIELFSWKIMDELLAPDKNKAQASRNKNLLRNSWYLYHAYLGLHEWDKAIEALISIGKYDSSWSIIQCGKIEDYPEFLRRELNKTYKDSRSIESYKQELEIQQSALEQSKARRNEIQSLYRICDCQYSLYRKQPDVESAIECIRQFSILAQRLTESDSQIKKAMTVIIETIRLACAMLYEIKIKEGKDEFVAKAFHLISSSFAYAKQPGAAIELGKIALAAYEVLERNQDQPDLTIVSAIATLYNNFAHWSKMVNDTVAALKFFQSAREYLLKHLDDDIEFVCDFVSSSSSMVMLYMDPKVNDLEKAEKLANSTLKLAQKYYNKDAGLDDHYIGIYLLLLIIDHQSGRDDQSDSIIRETQRLLKTNRTLTRSRKEQIEQVLNSYRLMARKKETLKKSDPVEEKRPFEDKTQKKVYSLDEAIDITLAHMSRKEIKEKILQYFDGPGTCDLHEMYKQLIRVGQMFGISYSIDPNGIIHEHNPHKS